MPATSSGLANNCQMGTFSAAATFSSVGYDGLRNIAYRFCRVVFIFSANVVILYPCFLISSSILFIFYLICFAKICLLSGCKTNHLQNNVKRKNIFSYILVCVKYIIYIRDIIKTTKY